MLLSPCCHATIYYTDGRKRYEIGSKSMDRRLIAQTEDIGRTFWHACSSCGQACDPIAEVEPE